METTQLHGQTKDRYGDKGKKTKHYFCEDQNLTNFSNGPFFRKSNQMNLIGQPLVIYVFGNMHDTI